MLSIENSVLLVIDFQERLMPVISGNEELTNKSEILIKGCRVLDVTILVTQQYTRGLGETVAPLREALGEFESIEKISFSCCGCSEFVAKLKETGKKDVLISGVEAHVCVQQTVLDLLDSGYNVYVIADCISSRSDSNRQYAELRMRDAGAVITTMESVLFELLKSADHPKRKEISNLVK